MEQADIPAWAQQLITLAVIIGTAFTAIRKGRKSAPEADAAKGDTAVLTATFMDRQSIRDLTSATLNLHGTLLELVDLMKTEARRREVDAEVRDELRKRGVMP